MAKQKKCEPGCTCGRHTRSGNRGHHDYQTARIDWSDSEARKAYNREKAREKYAADPEPAREAARRYRAANPGRRGRLRDAAADLKWLYGLSPERWQELFAAQEGCCYLCGEPLDTVKKYGITIDHDHSCCRGNRSCGTCVRGLACGRCNAGIGHFGDDPERMRRVADNLEMANRRLRQIPSVTDSMSGSNAPLGKD